MDRVYTKYPEQGGLMGELVQCIMQNMRHPIDEIAVITAHAVVSTLAGRTYAIGNSGVVLTAKIVGRSTIGKGEVMRNAINVLTQAGKKGGNLAFLLSSYLGHAWYTSPKNLAEDIIDRGSILAIKTESGQTDKSNAGDMGRVAMMELELATKSGPEGFVQPGKQNEKNRIPSLCSPAYTCIRESVFEIQLDADRLNKTAVSGAEGRTNHVVIRSEKPPYNEDQDNRLTATVAAHILKMHKKAQHKEICNAGKPHNRWIYVEYEDSQYLSTKREDWRIAENNAASDEDHLASTFYGRLAERVPAWAARLAIIENPNKPLIINRMIDTAVKSLMAERKAWDTKIVNAADPLEDLINRMVKIMQAGELHERKALYGETRKLNYDKMLQQGAVELSRLKLAAGGANAEIKKLYSRQNINTEIINRLKEHDIHTLNPKEAKRRFGASPTLLQGGWCAENLKN